MSSTLCPLFRHVFSLAPTPARRRSPSPASPSPSQAVARAVADLRAQEAALDNPPRTGHRIVQPGGGASSQGVLVAILQNPWRGGSVAPRGAPFTGPWRMFATREKEHLRLAWLKIEARSEDEVRKWLSTVKCGDEAEWADLMVRLAEWYKERGRGRGPRKIMGCRAAGRVGVNKWVVSLRGGDRCVQVSYGRQTT